MTIHRQRFEDGELKTITIDDTPSRKMRIKDPVLDLSREPNILDASGQFTTDDNIASDSETFLSTLPTQRPLLKGFLDSMQSYMDPEPLIKMLTGGCAPMVSGNFRMADTLIGYWPDASPEVYVVSHPTLEGCMQEYHLFQANPQTYFSDHAFSVMARSIGPYFAKDLHCEKKQGGTWKVTGHKYPIDDVLKATKNLTMMGNSFGSDFICKSENALKHMLHELEYSEDETRRIMTSIRAFTVSSMSPFAHLIDTPDAPDPRFTMIAMEGINDIVGHTLNRYKSVPTRDEISRVIPVTKQQKVWDALERHNDSLRANLTHPGANYYPPSKDPEALENTPLFIVRKTASNRLLILTTVPTYAEHWLFDMPGKRVKNYLSTLKELSDSVASDKDARLIALLRSGGKDAEQQLACLLEGRGDEKALHIKQLLESINTERDQFEGYLRVMKGDRAGHSIVFYLWPDQPLSQLCRRIAHHAVYPLEVGEEQRVEQMLNPVLHYKPFISQTGKLDPMDMILNQQLMPQLHDINSASARAHR